MNPIVHAAFLSALVAQTGDSKWFDSKQASRFVEVYKKEAAQYEIFSDGRTKLKAVPEPVFRWANPEDTNFNGTLFVWTRDGRAEVIGSIWSSHRKTPEGRRRIVHEFQTLSFQPVSATRSGVRSWYPRETAIDLKPVPDAPEPAASAGRRLIQIKALARQFSATEFIKDKPTELRMLPRPVYRYKSESGNDPDGAVFALLMDFDPEAFLIIEERQTQAGMRWHFGLAQFGVWPLKVKHKNTEVWACEYNRNMTDPRNPHFANSTATYTDWNLSEPANDDDASR